VKKKKQKRTEARRRRPSRKNHILTRDRVRTKTRRKKGYTAVKKMKIFNGEERIGATGGNKALLGSEWGGDDA